MAWHEYYHNSVRMNLNLTVTGKSVTALKQTVDHLVPKIGLDPKERNKKFLEVLLLNLFANYHLKSNPWIGISLRRNTYQAKSRYNSNNISHKIIDITKSLIEKGYIENTGFGHYPNDAWKKSYTTRIKATKKLTGIFYQYKMAINDVDVRPDIECIICKQSLKNSNVQVEYEDNEYIRKRRQILIAYNNLLRRTHIGIDGIPEDTGIIIGNSKYPVNVSNKNKWVRRIFIGEEENGKIPMYHGRYYGGWWQQLNSHWRDQIKINGLDTREIDFSGMGIRILYDLAKLKMEGDDDPYNLTGYYHNPKYTMEELRPLLKQVLIVMVNCKSRPQAVGAIQKEVNDVDNDYPTDVNTKELMNAFYKRHIAIKKYFYSSIGNIQYLFDSSVVELIIDYYTSKGIPVLTVHDSFVTTWQNEYDLEERMTDFYARIMNNYKDEIKVKLEHPREYIETRKDYQTTSVYPLDTSKDTDYIIGGSIKGELKMGVKGSPYEIIDGTVVGIKRNFKDKHYKKDITEWAKSKPWNSEDYFPGGYSFGASEGDPSKEELEAELSGDYKTALKIWKEDLTKKEKEKNK